jgi:N-ethylmaleimide reductase
MAFAHLFEPYERGGLRLAHRIAMAPLTRNRAPATIPGELNATYYAQRASAAILVTEGTHPDPVGQGYLDIAGLHDDVQQQGGRGSPTRSTPRGTRSSSSSSCTAGASRTRSTPVA